MTRNRFGACLVWLACLTLSSCSSTPDRPLMTLPQQLQASQPGFDGIRFFVDETAADLAPFIADFRPATGNRPTYLALSGGGEGGAYGAGVMVGWTQSGRRPEFDLVTGISAGALIAPFAFAGAEWDPVLRDLFESGMADRLNTPPSLLAGLFGGGVLAGSPLQEMIAARIDRDLLDQIAERHAAGARLLVVTTNIDAERNVIWNMGAIAASERDDAEELFENVLAASASIPAVFPPVSISSTVDGEVFEELHVDGGAIRQIYFFPEAFLAHADWSGLNGQRPRIYAIANNEVAPRYDPVPARGLDIAGDAFSTLLKASLVQTLTKMQEFAEDHDMPFHLTYIDQFIPTRSDLAFDPDYMRAAFTLGEYAGHAQTWRRRVPIGTDLLSAPLPDE